MGSEDIAERYKNHILENLRKNGINAESIRTYRGKDGNYISYVDGYILMTDAPIHEGENNSIAVGIAGSVEGSYEDLVNFLTYCGNIKALEFAYNKEVIKTAINRDETHDLQKGSYWRSALSQAKDIKDFPNFPFIQNNTANPKDEPEPETSPKLAERYLNHIERTFNKHVQVSPTSDGEYVCLFKDHSARGFFLTAQEERYAVIGNGMTREDAIANFDEQLQAWEAVEISTMHNVRSLLENPNDTPATCEETIEHKPGLSPLP